ncbi:FdrA family protein [Knoellia sinensis KCTC 19936]|uniref:FdrA family protein n=1 Tax=Knoellia sinensis KCTC 19936 TaxID=1385520 RepID=A0A0A0JBD8_9MICO|nr:FdrA family protein [Knoellia sinensis]KGN32931.1 FdrA family protein [Knoellia sinensis KCTC 19936]
MTVTQVDVRKGAYHDSVTLLQVSRTMGETAGVEAAQVAMATELNVEVLTGMGFDIPDTAGPNDLVVAVRAADDEAVAAGVAAADAALTATSRAPGGGFGDAPPPRTTASAVRAGGAEIAMISVPGRFATTEALDAIGAGASVMLFSDNVSVEDEVLLKDAAAAADVLVMGPDCGTAVIGGVALGFANVVDAGPIGMVAASGTGAQQIMCLLDAAGVGISHCLGVGGRDLKSAVGGRSTRQALAALAADDATTSIVVVSKPPDEEVLADLESYAGGLGLPVHWATLGAGRPDLTSALEAVLRAEGRDVPGWPKWLSDNDPEPGSVSGSLRGLFCGGTLADEAMLLAAEELGDIRSNIPLRDDLALGSDLRSDGHVVIDFGDDGLTQGRAHPMIDPTLRMERISAEAADPTCGVLLLDLVLGYGAHQDPAGELADAIRAAKDTARADGRELPVVVSLTGTEGDPQGLTRTALTLAAAGASVFLSNRDATRHALSFLGGDR